MRCHDPQTCTTSRHQTCYMCPSIRGGTHIRLPRAALSPLRFSAPLSHSPPRSTLLVLAGTTTFQTQPFRSTRCPRPIATPHALPRAVSTASCPCVLPLRAGVALHHMLVHPRCTLYLRHEALNRSMQGPRYAMLVHLAITLSTVHGWVVPSDDKASSLSSHESAITGGIDGARRQLKASGCSGSWSVCPPAPRPLLHIIV